MTRGVLIAAAALSVVLTASASGQGTRVRVTAQAAAGTQLNVGGDNQSIAVGLSPNERIDLLVSAERIHQPTDRGIGATRGGTATFFSGEVRVVPVTFGRTSPYVLASLGGGTSRPTVSETFPDRVENDAWLLLFGAGARIGLTRRLSAFADVRVGIQGELDVISLLVPIRAGLALRF
jgi:hypothetical protein